MVFALEIFGHLTAEETASDRVVRIPGDFGGAASRVDGEDKRAGVRAIKGADRMFLLRHSNSIVAEWVC